ncbi:MAG: hypothetical protein EAX95_07805 [Candidatus Thorarchaeota archaeon]|nr:hypothetical protein [Candidatus Thorarchaeota archaeon]
MSVDSEDITPPTLYTKRTLLWMLMTFILTPLTAGLLAYMGYIPFSVEMAMIDGIIVAFVYIGFRVCNAERKTRIMTKQ